MVELNNNYEKNIQALKNVDVILATKIIQSAMGESFELSTVNAKHQLYNILDHMHERALYHNIVDELQTQIKELQSHINTPFLYLFGIGNGYTLPILLQNSNHKRIVIFEAELELFFVTFHIYDFSKEILSGRVKFFHQKSFDFAQAIHLFSDHNAKYHPRNFSLIITADYYSENFKAEIQNLQALLIEALSYHLSFAKDFITQLNYLENQITNSSLQDGENLFSTLLEKSQQGSWALIINDTPDSSLVEILRSLRNSLTIICCETFINDLLEHDIQADIVVSISYNNALWQNIPIEIQKKIILILPDYNEHLKLKNNQTKKVMTHHKMDRYFDFKPFGDFHYHADALSMAYEISCQLKHSHTIIFDSSLKEESTFSFQNLSYLTALYREKMKTYILREKGMRQLQAQSKSIKSLEEIVQKQQAQAQAPIFDLQALDSDEKAHFKARHQLQLIHLINIASTLLLILQNHLQEMEPWYNELNNLENETLLNYYSDAQISLQLDRISTMRGTIAQDPSYQRFFHDFLLPSMLLIEVEMASIQTLSEATPLENRNKAMQWSIINYKWLNQLHHSVFQTIEQLQKHQKS